MKKKLTSLQINLIISVIFMLIFCFKNTDESIILTLSNGFFIIGTIYFCIALSIHVRNLGFLKSLTYIKYRREKNALKKKYLEQHILEPLPSNFNNFTEFMLNKYIKKVSANPFYIIAIPSITLSVVFLFVYYK